MVVSTSIRSCATSLQVQTTPCGRLIFAFFQTLGRTQESAKMGSIDSSLSTVERRFTATHKAADHLCDSAAFFVKRRYQNNGWEEEGGLLPFTKPILVVLCPLMSTDNSSYKARDCIAALQRVHDNLPTDATAILELTEIQRIAFLHGCMHQKESDSDAADLAPKLYCNRAKNTIRIGDVGRERMQSLLQKSIDALRSQFFPPQKEEKEDPGVVIQRRKNMALEHNPPDGGLIEVTFQFPQWIMRIVLPGKGRAEISGYNLEYMHILEQITLMEQCHAQAIALAGQGRSVSEIKSEIDGMVNP